MLGSKPTRVGVNDSIEHDYEEDGGNATLHEDRTFCHVPTMLLIAGVMCLGVVVVGAVCFFPMYFVSFAVAEHAIRAVHLQAINAFLAATNTSLTNLPNLINAIAVNYIPALDAQQSAFPENKEQLLFSLSNVLSKEGYTDTVSYIFAASAGPPENEWGVLAGTYFKQHSVCGTVMHGMNSTPVYQMDPENANYAFPRRPLVGYNVSLNATLNSNDGPYKTIVKPWNENRMQGVLSRKRWYTTGIRFSSLYFDYVVPFSFSGVLGFWEIAMNTSVLDHRLMTIFYKALRENGRFMLIDPAEQIVVTNNWGQLRTREEFDGDTVTVYPLRLTVIDDPLMRETVENIRVRGGFNKLMKERNRIEILFPYGNTKAFAHFLRLTDDSGLDVMMCITTLQSDFFHAVYRSRMYVGLATGVSIIIVIALAVSIACFLVRPLQRLVPELERASNLQLRGENDKSNVWRKSRIAEVQGIQDAYADLTRQLAVLKTFVPAAILAPPSNNASIHDYNSQGAWYEASLQLDGSSMHPQTGMGMMEQSNLAKVQQEMRLNSQIFKEQTNAFVRRHCTVVFIENAQPSSLDAYFHNILTCAAQQNGCVECLRPDRTLVSFGAHLRLPMHAIRGCRFAFELFARLTPQEKETITLFIDTNEFHVGTCGAQSKNARVVVGVMALRELAKIANRLGCRIAATSGTSSQLQEHQVYPVECVFPSSSTESVVLSELRPHAPFVSTMMSTAKHFRLGFAAMRQGHYRQAITHYRRIDNSDPQAQRLIRLCIRRCLQNDNSSYVRSASDILKEFLPAVSITAADEKGPVSAIHSSDPATQGDEPSGSEAPFIPSTHSSRNRASGSDGGALIEMFDVSCTPTNTDVQTGEGGYCGTDDMPHVLTDMNHKVWTLSLEKISEGAFSTVFLGISEDGVQVAIKCIPRRRRDIMQENLEAEMNVASKLCHPNIVQYVSCSVVQSHLAIIMEYVPGGSLHTVIKSFGRVSSLVARRFTVDILNGLNYLHTLGIVHCDVKPHNVLLGMDGVCKLSDFGSTISEATEMTRTMEDDLVLRGTALYMAPEVAAGGRCTPQSDIFSLGISLLELLLGRLPWRWTSKAPEGSDATSLQALFNRDHLFVQSLARGCLEPEIPEFLESEVSLFLRACCHPNPAMRPSAFGLLSFAFVL